MRVNHTIFSLRFKYVCQKSLLHQFIIRDLSLFLILLLVENYVFFSEHTNFYNTFPFCKLFHVLVQSDFRITSFA